MATEGHNGMSPGFILYVKLGRDDLGLSACPSCHHVFMLALEKVSAGGGSLAVRRVNPSRPPDAWRSLCRRLPTLESEEEPGEVAADIDEIPAYLEARMPKPETLPSDSKAVAAVLDVFHKFTFFIRSLTASHQPLESELEKLDRHLGSHGQRFLCGNGLSELDFEFLPKLHQVRVACAALKDYSIPTRLQHVWHYLGEGYKLESFRKSCPSDEEIVFHWGQKVRIKSPKVIFRLS